MKKYLNRWLCVALCFVLFSCNDFLSERNSSFVSNISSLADMQALLDAVNTMNFGSYTALLEIATDDIFVGRGGFDRASDLEKSLYIWDKEYIYTTLREVNSDWTSTYQLIATVNTILDELPLVTDYAGLSIDHVKGAALFHRAFAYHTLVQVYCKAYDPKSAGNDLGLPMRMNSDVNLPSTRATLEETFRLIENDIKLAIDLLPVTSAYPTRPNQAAAHALLARVYLLMERYADALGQATLSLSINNSLLDYNNLNNDSPNPITQFNEETLFYAYIDGAGILTVGREFYVDSALYNSYHSADLRKDIYFERENNGFQIFRASYTGLYPSYSLFIGLTTSEMLLIKAECMARLGDLESSNIILNMLLINRYKRAYFEPEAITDSDILLARVLEERRKELLFRGVRWSDLKRLNRDPRFAKTLYRKVPGNEWIQELPPNDPRYVFLIPQDVIDMTGMEQNPR